MSHVRCRSIRSEPCFTSDGEGRTKGKHLFMGIVLQARVAAALPSEIEWAAPKAVFYFTTLTHRVALKSEEL